MDSYVENNYRCVCRKRPRYTVLVRVISLLIKSMDFSLITLKFDEKIYSTVLIKTIILLLKFPYFYFYF